MPLCSYRKYTISEIINAVIKNEFTLNRFDEHPSWTNENVPGEFTIIAKKNKTNFNLSYWIKFKLNATVK